jgi:hypothetical protein
MDDDITFGASVWGTSDSVDTIPSLRTNPPILSTSSESQFGEDQFDDFDDPVQTVQADAADDDFGDFGDFDEAEVVNSTGFEDDVGFGEEVRIAGPSSHTGWHPLRLDPLPPRSELENQVNSILEPIWGSEDISEVLTDEGIREVEGVSQILVTPERSLFLFIVPCLN